MYLLFDKIKHSESLYLDFEKAFDEVNEQKLVEKVGYSSSMTLALDCAKAT